MSFKHKLSRRLAMLFGVVVVAVIACEIPARTTSPTPTVAALIISPEAVAVQPNQDVVLMAVGLMTSGDTAQIMDAPREDYTKRLVRAALEVEA